jgi:hypothetical protein
VTVIRRDVEAAVGAVGGAAIKQLQNQTFGGFGYYQPKITPVYTT